MQKKGKPVLEFQSTEWLQDLAFIVDITEHLNNLNKMLYGHTANAHSSWSWPLDSWNCQVVTLLIFLVKKMWMPAVNAGINSVQRQDYGTAVGVWVMVSDLWWTWDRFHSFSLTIYSQGSDLLVKMQLEIIACSVIQIWRTKLPLWARTHFISGCIPIQGCILWNDNAVRRLCQFAGSSNCSPQMRPSFPSFWRMHRYYPLRPPIS